MKKEVMGKIKRATGSGLKGGSTKERMSEAKKEERSERKMGERNETKKSDKVNKVVGKYAKVK